MTCQTLTRNELFLKNIPWTESPFFEELLNESSFSTSTKKKVKFFADNGYLIIDPEIKNFSSLADEIISSLRPEQLKHGSRVQDAWRYLPSVKTLACHPEVLNWLRILYQREPVPFQTLNFSKGTEQATHSDIVHFSSVPQRFMAGVWFALEDVDQDNGALHYYPGSHKLPVFDLHDIGLSKSTLSNRDLQYKEYESFVKVLMEKKGYKKETIQIKKGSYLIWSANLFHGGDPIKDKSRTRHSLVTHCYFDQCRYYNPLYSDVAMGNIAWKEVTDIQSGKKISHYYNGKKVSLPMKTKARYLIENFMRKNRLGREIFANIKRALTRA